MTLNTGVTLGLVAVILQRGTPGQQSFILKNIEMPGAPDSYLFRAPDPHDWLATACPTLTISKIMGISYSIFLCLLLFSFLKFIFIYLNNLFIF